MAKSKTAQVEGISEAKKTYLVRRKIRCGMICTFVVSLLLISTVSILFFFIFLDYTLEISVQSIFLAHTYSIVGDIIQVKKNDFMLSQNELKISKGLINELIEGSNFNFKSLGGENLDNLDLFNKYTANMFYYQKTLNETGEAPFIENKVLWAVSPVEYDVAAFETQILKILNKQDIDSSYTDFTQQQMRDIITCAASIYLRADYSMNFQYTDLPKDKNFIGFESGVICIYPNQEGWVFTMKEDPDNFLNCQDNEFYATTYNPTTIPGYYDPRCRGWYEDVYEKKHQTLSDIYTYASGKLGLTNCIPLWTQIDDTQPDSKKEFQGAYCLDLYPTSDNDDFVSKYYQPDQGEKVGMVDYLIFTEDEAFKEGDLNESNIFEYLQGLVFSLTNTDINYEVEEITLTNKTVNELTQYMNQFGDEYDLEKVAKLPEEPIVYGEIKVKNLDYVGTGDDHEYYIFICDKFNVSLNYVEKEGSDKYEDTREIQYKDYTFMLILPKFVIQNKIDAVNQEVRSQIMNFFIIPFASFSLVMMIVISFCLVKISSQITSPIIELQDKIKQIISAHQKEKDVLIKEQESAGVQNVINRLDKQGEAEKDRKENTKEFNIMLNYKPRNHEINVLYLAFSNLTKTIKVARNSLYEGDDNQALLNYHEVAQIFDQLNNRDKLGSCMNNLGCIYLKKDQYDNSFEFLNESIHIQQEIITKERDKKDVSDKDQMSNQFIIACRHYNKALACQRYITKIILEQIHFHSLCQFVKVIPDEYQNHNNKNLANVSNKAEIFLQMAALACLAKHGKKYLFKLFSAKNPALKRKLQTAYNEMVDSFDQSQETLKNQRFNVVYDDSTMQLVDATSGSSSKPGEKSQLKRISYFSDFIFMQQLMTIEIDIVLGNTRNGMKHLGKNTNDEDDDDDDDKGKKSKTKKGKDGEDGDSTKKKAKSNFNLDHDNLDLNTIESNRKKINLLEDTMSKFFKIFTSNSPDEFNETIQDKQRLRMMEKYERFGLQLFRKDHLLQYINYLKGLQSEIEMGDFYAAKKYYIKSLTDTVYVNHRIRKDTLLKLMAINRRIGFPKESPEKTLISRYYIKQKYVQVVLDSSSFLNTKTLKSTMNLPKMLFNDLGSQDHFGLKVLKNGYQPGMQLSGSSGQPSPKYLQDVILMEAKEMNTSVKMKYLDDFTQELQAHDKKFNRFNGKDAQLKNREMQKQTLSALSQTINKMNLVEEYNVEQIDGNWIRGPMKWIVIILGPNHNAKDLRQLLVAKHTNLNIVVILITNSNMHQIAANQNKQTMVDGQVVNKGDELEKVLEEENAEEEQKSDEDEDDDDEDKSKRESGATKKHDQSKSRGTGNKTKKSRTDISYAKSIKSTEMERRAKQALNQSRQLPVDMDQVTKNLNKLCRNTPEGYMITIQQRQFEGRENGALGNGSGKKDQNETLNVSKSVMDNSQMVGIKQIAKSQVGQFSKEVEKIFQKVCQSMEVYKCTNIPIITEFLEF